MDQVLPFKKILLRKQKELDLSIKALKQSDPFFLEDGPERVEVGVASWQTDVHIKTLAMRNSLYQMGQGIKKALQKIKQGTYGICENCHRLIDPDRLLALPSAPTCKFCL